MKKYSFLLLVFIAGAMFSCSKEKIMTYEGETQIYFAYGEGFYNREYGNGKLVDSVNYYFAYDVPVKADSVFETRVKIQGNPVDYARKISFRVIPELSTAEEGIDFTLLDSYIMPDSIGGQIRIRVNNNPKLNNAGVAGQKMVVELLANENFNVDYTKTTSSQANADTVKIWNSTRYTFVYSGVIGPPITWLSGVPQMMMNSAFGPYSQTKYGFMVSFLGSEVSTLLNPSPVPDDLYNYIRDNLSSKMFEWKSYCNEELRRLNAAGTPVVDDRTGKLLYLASKWDGYDAAQAAYEASQQP